MTALGGQGSYQEANGNFKGNTVQVFMAEFGQSVTISQALHKVGLYCRVARKKPLPKGTHGVSFAKEKHLEDSNQCGWMRPKLNFLE
ncbi:hypothetical protein UPYG_G00085330 [Umbra pygmaea]|uniref:Uncharacterized protein n=1 Tax=Umbra pygmaea TaxID=75934 RepID=A0ABD0XEK9_UMBPY